jgi:glycosyltransferase involved in cell wall biosynthesis
MIICVCFSYGISLNDWFVNGSIDRELLIYKELNKKGYKFIFITYGGDYDKKLAEKYKFIEIIPIYSIVKRSKSKFINLFKLIKAAFLIKNKIKKVNILKTNQLTAGVLACLLKFLSNKKLILRLGFEPLQQLEIENKYSKLSLIFIKFIFLLMYMYSDLISVSSNQIKNFIVNKYNISPIKIKYNWNYVDTNFFKPLGLEKKNRLLFIGRLVDVKNIFFLLQSLVDTEIGLDIIGDGKLKGKIKQFIKTNNLDVKILNPVDHFKLPLIINTYSIYVICSNIEGNPKTLLEAMSCETTVIATNAQGINEIIINNVNGIISQKNSKKFLQNIISLINNSKSRSFLASNARKLIIKNCSIENYLKYEISLYKNLYE